VVCLLQASEPKPCGDFGSSLCCPQLLVEYVAAISFIPNRTMYQVITLTWV